MVLTTETWNQSHIKALSDWAGQNIQRLTPEMAAGQLFTQVSHVIGAIFWVVQLNNPNVDQNVQYELVGATLSNPAQVLPVCRQVAAGLPESIDKTYALQVINQMIGSPRDWAVAIAIGAIVMKKLQAEATGS
jgi:hypothetical protein